MVTLIKKALFYITKGNQIFFSNKKRHKTSFLYFPYFNESSQLSDHINRIRWYIPNNDHAEVRIFVRGNIRDGQKLSPPPNQRTDIVQNDSSHIKTYRNLNISFKAMLEADIICVWDVNASIMLKVLPFIYKVRIVDPTFYKYTESHTNSGLLWYDIFNEKMREKAIRRSHELYSNFSEQYDDQSKTSFLFGTGPSIDISETANFNDGINIICNTIVKNKKLLVKIKPKAITFTDCVFHFGVSKYCELFLSDVRKVSLEYNSLIITNLVGYALISTHYPELEDKLIGLPAYRKGKPSIVSRSKFRAKAYPYSIITRIMLPFAAGISKKIVMIGFDGRDPEDTYFWKHNQTVQYENMKDVWDCHPTFFSDTDYKKHYEGHCKVLDEVITELEEKGKEIKEWGFSYVPILNDRIEESN